MSSFGQWLSMGGYSFYVWTAYGVVGSVFLLHALQVAIQKKRTLQRLRYWFKKAN